MKKALMVVGVILCILGLSVFVKVKLFPEPVEINVLENLELEYTGIQGEGTAKVIGNDIQYDGNDQKVFDFLDSIEYTIEPNKNLSNYEDVKVSIKYDEKLKEEANVELVTIQQSFQVTGLEETPEQKAERVEVVDGVEVPRDWEMNDEEKQAYIDMMKQIEEQGDGMMEEDGVNVQWTQGTSDAETHKSNKKFLFEDYANNTNITYQRASEYGMTSSQEFMIKPIMDGEENIGYECVFKES